MWHDLGKRRPGFQRYLRQAGGADAHIEGRIADRDKTHSAAGALWAEQHLSASLGKAGTLLSRLLQYVIAGHHAGLDNWEGGLAHRLASTDSQTEFQQALGGGNPDDVLKPDLSGLDWRALPPFNEQAHGDPGRMALWLRMLFSALVDADFLDTEAYMRPARTTARTVPVTIGDLRDVCSAHLHRLCGGATGSINLLRADILHQCRHKASLPAGVFSLTVPTGGGKTLSSLAFALEHAAFRGKRRVVYAIPYTSIIEQTADVFRNVFESLGDEVVIEHHSNAESEPERENHLSRLACENWDAPLIVTTNVQLFESLFARRTSRCRKLHNLADSVLVLDEAQLLPVVFLQPIVDVLRYLVKDFGVTVLLCTATQPVLDAAASADPSHGLRRGLGQVTEIIDDVPALYSALERVRVHLPVSFEAPREWSELADEISQHESVLAIVSRRADAAELYRLLKARSATPQGCWHLSALMCAEHRSDTIRQIKQALTQRRAALAEGRPALPVQVVSTQLVEAGVDLDFPVVYRAMAGLDSIAQAAGRCNREGKLAEPGQVHVFVPPTRSPPGLLTLARDICKTVWHDRPEQPFALPLIQSYFQRLLHDAHSTDAKGICDMQKLSPDAQALALPLRFRDVADAFKLIDNEDGGTVIVRYQGINKAEDVNALIGKLQREGPARWLMRKLQRYGVTVYQHHIRALLKAGDIEELPLCPGLYVQRDGFDAFYDPVLGARVDSAPGDPAMYVA
jgi:CRISPR-associated endonuclease/helicase Cas3